MMNVLKRMNLIAMLLSVLLLTISMIPAIQLSSYGIDHYVRGLYFIILFSIFTIGIVDGRLCDLQTKFIVIILFIMAFIIFIIDYLDGGVIYDGYKFILILPIIFASNEFVKYINVKIFINTIFIVLSLYIMITYSYMLSAGSDIVSTYLEGNYSRYKITGSLTNHAILSTLHVLITYIYLKEATSKIIKSAFALLIAPSIVMLFLTASRQPIIVFAFYFLITIYMSKSKGKEFLKLSLIFFLLVCIFLLYSYYIDSSLYYRIFGLDDSRFSSGRFEAVYYWYGEFIQHGALGFGYISTYANAISTGEWPHNEFIRFYFEGGLLGIIWLLALTGSLLNMVRHIATNNRNPYVIGVSVAILSIILVQFLVENLFNQIYRMTFYVLLISILYSKTKQERILATLCPVEERYRS